MTSSSLHRCKYLARRIAVPLYMFLTVSGAAPRIAAQSSSTAALGTSRQPSQPPFPSFDVATIKPSSKTVGGMGLGKSTPDTIDLVNTSPRSLIAHAYDLPEWAIVGGPNWLANTEYDIEAKILPDDHGVLPRMSRTEIQERIKGLLAQRFGLVCHFETRRIPVYDLSVIGSGARLKQATPGDSYPNGIPGPDGRTGPGLMTIKNNMFVGQAIPIAGLVDTLSLLLQRTVIDKTGLTGLYDISLAIPTGTQGSATPPVPAAGPSPPAAEPSDTMASSLSPN